jgi:hypothetical protein
MARSKTGQASQVNIGKFWGAFGGYLVAACYDDFISHGGTVSTEFFMVLNSLHLFRVPRVPVRDNASQKRIRSGQASQINVVQISYAFQGFHVGAFNVSHGDAHSLLP